jgi:predicted nucleotidyltransferase
MIPQDANRAMLEAVAMGLQSLVDDVVFLGGCTAGLLITDPAAPIPRQTNDVDMIVEVSSHLDYHTFSAKLRRNGFQEDKRANAPLCRWIYQSMQVDVMPTHEEILGFSNRWYAEALQHSVWVNLSQNTRIRMISAPYFLATKLEAFYGRGHRDYIMSHDLEDMVAVIDGRDTIVGDVAQSTNFLRTYLAKEFTQLLQQNDFQDALQGYLAPDAASQARISIIKARMQVISSNNR